MIAGTLKGVLEYLWLPRSARPGSPAFNNGMLALRLNDGTRVALGRESAARQLALKYQDLTGKKVCVDGIDIGFQPLWGPREADAIVMPLIEPVNDIQPC